MFVVPDFGATCVTPSIVGCRGGPILAVFVCGAGFWCHVFDLPLYCGLWGDLFGHVCLWCQILVPHMQPPSVVGCGGLPGHICLVPDFGAMHTSSIMWACR